MSTLLNYINLWRLCAVLGLLAPSLAGASHDTEPRITAAERLSMGDLVAAVVARNAGLAEMRAAAEAAQQRILPAGALDDPSLSYAIAPQTIDGFVTPAGQSRSANQRLEISQAIPWPGKRDLRAASAKFEAAAADADVDAVRLQLVAHSKARYTEWYYIHKALTVNAANIELLEELRSVAENRYASGLVGQQDVLKAEVSIQDLHRQRLDMTRICEQVAARINALLHRSQGSDLPPPSGLPAMQGVPDAVRIEDLAVSRHPELTGLERMVAANEARRELADKEFLPDFEVFAGYNSLWDETAKRWTVGVGINVPFGRDKRRAARSEASANVRRLQFQLDDRRARLLGDVRQAHAAMKQAWMTVRLFEEELIPRTTENLTAARAEYSSGGGSFLDVISAEEQKLRAELGVEQARADFFIAAADLERWTGGELPLADRTGHSE